MTRSHLQFAILGGVILFGLWVRVVNPLTELAADLCFCQAENTDWAWYLNHALSQAGLTNLDTNLASYDSAFWSFYTHAVLQIFSDWHRALSFLNVLPGTLLILLMFLCLRPHGRGVAIFGALLTAGNFLLISYSRTPLVYIWLSVAQTAAILLWRIQGKKPWSHRIAQLTAIFLLLFAAHEIKFMAAFFLPCLFLATLLSSRDLRRIDFGPMAIGAFLILVAFFWSGIGSDIKGKFVDYLGEFRPNTTLRGEVRIFYQQFVIYFASRLPLELAFAISFGGFLLFIRRKGQWPELTDSYFLVVFLLGLLLIIPFPYRPVRYLLFLVPAIIYLASRGIFTILEKLPVTRGARYFIVGFVLFFLALEQGAPLAQYLMTKDQTLQESREDLAEMIPAGSTLTGPAAHALTAGTPFHAVYLGVYAWTLDGFLQQAKKAGVNYLVADLASAHELETNPKSKETVKNWLFLDSLFIRGFEVKLYRLNKQGPRSFFEEALYEKAKKAREKKLLQSMASFPLSGAAARTLAFENFSRKETQSMIDEALKRNPTHPLPWLLESQRQRKQNKNEQATNSALEAIRLSANSDYLRQHLDLLLELKSKPFTPFIMKTNPAL